MLIVMQAAPQQSHRLKTASVNPFQDCTLHSIGRHFYSTQNLRLLPLLFKTKQGVFATWFADSMFKLRFYLFQEINKTALCVSQQAKAIISFGFMQTMYFSLLPEWKPNTTRCLLGLPSYGHIFLTNVLYVST